MNEPGTKSNTHFLVSRQVTPLSGSSLFGDVMRENFNLTYLQGLLDLTLP